MQKLDEIVKMSIENTNRFPDLSIILNAINEGHEIDVRFKNNLINHYVKEDDDLLKVVRLMISKNYEFNKFDIFDLAKNGFFKTMDYFKSLDFDLNIKNEQGENALFYIIRRDVSRFNYIDKFWRREDYIETIVENCIKLGIDEKAVNNQGRNLLHAYALSGMPSVYFDTLIKYDIDINKIDNNGWTPLHCICAYNGDDDEYKKFLAFGADKTIYTKKRLTYFEEEFDAEPTSEICSAYDLRLYYLNSLGGEYSEGTEYGDFVRKEIELYLKP
ncbi:ankyrin repeat domain-containing protein [Runella sp. MFBS21]|uniref:ankyrin repeat domain-containing protein n=1 Tax=Runella sp. MFBS21 TaxID=3034018 RepID=UPI0023F67D67|nr:ankyrin repeat domain-containing protein [Runella sp. MFBS21]MDF7822351.1 ankyrin repeat domain-containing protein [Runella sp. MFBS21]